jgi:hypothetical protein
MLAFLLSAASPAVAQERTATLTANDGADFDNFGYVLDADQDRLLIGAPGRDSATANAGIAYVFRRDGDAWVQEAALLASDPERGAEFGDAVALQGRFAYVGSNRRDNGRGGIYVFELDDGEWVERTLLTPSDADQNDAFSYDFEVAGDRMLVGAFGDSQLAEFAGAAYVFERDASGAWTEAAKLTPGDPEASGWFGAFVALDGDRALLGATGVDEETGAAYIFERDSDGSWSQVARLAASDGAAGDRFGGQVALDGDYAYVAAPRADAGAQTAGKVYVFRREGNQWSEVAQLTSSSPIADGRLGRSLAARGDMLLVGSLDEGTVYRFERTTATTWEEQARLPVSDPGSALGRDLVLTEDALFVGENGYEQARGAVHQFPLDGTSTAAARPASPASLRIVEAYPNPFTTSTRIAFTLLQSADVSVAVFDLLGRRVHDRPARRLAPGSHTVHLDLAGHPAGVYLYHVQMQSGGHATAQTGRIVLR